MHQPGTTEGSLLRLTRLLLLLVAATAIAQTPDEQNKSGLEASDIDAAAAVQFQAAAAPDAAAAGTVVSNAVAQDNVPSQTSPELAPEVLAGDASDGAPDDRDSNRGDLLPKPEAAKASTDTPGSKAEPSPEAPEATPDAVDEKTLATPVEGATAVEPEPEPRAGARAGARARARARAGARAGARARARVGARAGASFARRQRRCTQRL